MPRDTVDLPIIGRAAEVRAESIDRDARTIEIVWTTGAVVRRARWEGWDERVEYDEELIVSENAVRLERLNAGAPFLNSHSAFSLESVIGSVVPGSVRIEGGQGFATIQLTDAPDAAGVVQRIMERSVRNVSVGYRVHQFEITKRDGERELWRAVDWEPMEISAVAIGADPQAQVRSGEGSGGSALIPCAIIRRDETAAVAAQQGDGNMPPEDLAPGQGTETRSATPAPAQPPATPPGPTHEQVRAEERERVSQIAAVSMRHGMDQSFIDEHVRSGASIDAVRGLILDQLAGGDASSQRRSEAAPARPHSDDSAYRGAMVEAIEHRFNPQGDLTSGAREFRGMRLLDMARDALERGGVSTRGMSQMELASAALTVRAGVGYHATSDFPAILSTVANNTLRASYSSTPRTFMRWARRATITDFKPVQRSQLGGAPDLMKVPEGGEFKYGTMGDGKEVYALTTYGRIIGITRQALVNDELEAFTRIPAAFGASAADLESDLVYAILTGNPGMADNKALFHADHGNLLTAAAINDASLAAAMRAFGQQKGTEKRLISVLPRFIIVPPGPRAVEAKKAVAATTPAKASDINAYAGELDVISEPRLIPTSGQDPWFLAADPARIDTVEYASLDGQEGVYTETRQGFEVDGLEIKARQDFAAKAIDWRGLSKNPGAAAA